MKHLQIPTRAALAPARHLAAKRHPSQPHTPALLSSLPFCPLSCTPGIFRYRSPHYSSIQPQQTHKQISRLRHSQSLSLALSGLHTPLRYEPGAGLARLPCSLLQKSPTPQPPVTVAPNTIKSRLPSTRSNVDQEKGASSMAKNNTQTFQG